ncbi:MAG: cytochrome d ubiquinol oxidase subunit II [Bacteroidales bacterium]|nr:cytochrome d ubiquinol oxidase subunit II [Bacteroidales bacterium]
MVSYLFLQHYWWFIISLLAGLLVFLMFVQGGQSFIFSLSENESQKTMIINALGKKWGFTFTTLVTFGGAFFASFPLFYASSFGGAYWLWMTILFSFVIQAVAYEYRSKPSNVFGKKTFDVFLFINGALGPFLIGTVVGTFFSGSEFSLNEMNQVSWANRWHGLEALTDARNVSLGLAVLFLTRMNGLLYLINRIDDEDLNSRSFKKLISNTVFFLAFFIFFLITLFVAEGYQVDNNSGSIVTEKFKYFNNLLEMPLVLIIFLLGVLAVLYGVGISVFRHSTKGIWFTGPGTIMTVLALFLIAGFNNTAFYPSSFDPGSSLTIRNASSSFFTLNTMMYFSFIIPFVIAYIWFAWKGISGKKITGTVMKKSEHIY